MSSARHHSALKRGRTHTIGLMVFCWGLVQCNDPPPPPLQNYDPRFQPVLSTTATKTVKTKLIAPKRGRIHPLVAAKDRILGIHVPTNFVLKKRSPGQAFGEAVSKTRNIKAFYTSLGYQIVEQRAGLRIYPSDRTTRDLDPASRDLAKRAYLNLFRRDNLVWSLQIHAPPPDASPQIRPDPMAFILEKLNNAQNKTNETDENLNTGEPIAGTKLSPKKKAATPERNPTKSTSKRSRPSVKRVKTYIKPKGTVNVRPGLRQWNKEHPEQPFLD